MHIQAHRAPTLRQYFLVFFATFSTFTTLYVTLGTLRASKAGRGLSSYPFCVRLDRERAILRFMLLEAEK